MSKTPDKTDKFALQNWQILLIAAIFESICYLDAFCSILSVVSGLK